MRYLLMILLLFTATINAKQTNQSVDGIWVDKSRNTGLFVRWDANALKISGQDKKANWQGVCLIDKHQNITCLGEGVSIEHSAFIYKSYLKFEKGKSDKIELIREVWEVDFGTKKMNGTTVYTRAYSTLN